MDQPTPKENQVLVRNHATSVNYGHLVARKFKEISPREFNMPFPFWLTAKVSFGLSKPRTRILGSEFAGEIEATGKDVKRFKEGDQVFGYLGPSMGACAEYLCVPEDGVLACKPANMTYEKAAAVPSGGMTALYILGEVGTQSGQKPLSLARLEISHLHRARSK